MSKALDLLNSLSDEEITTLSVGSSEEELVVVGEDRFISVPASLRRVAVQSDHRIERVRFRCPRYWDGNDLSEMSIGINYMLSNGFKDRSLVYNLSILADDILFDWIITDNVTQVSGRISFLVCAIKTDIDGIEIQHWNSELNQEMYVSEGLECNEAAVSIYPDIIGGLLARMDIVEDVSVKAEEMEQLVATLEDNAQDIKTATSRYEDIVDKYRSDLEESFDLNMSTNLLNPLLITRDHMMVPPSDDPIGGELDWGDGSNDPIPFGLTGYIPVKPNTRYTYQRINPETGIRENASLRCYYQEFDISKNQLETPGSTYLNGILVERVTTDERCIVTDSNTAYIRVYLHDNANSEQMAIVEDMDIIPYEEYSKALTLKPECLPDTYSTELSLKDVSTGRLYKLYVDNGKLMLAESEG